MKIDPIFYWWNEFFNSDPVEMNIGYRCTEVSRAEKMVNELNKNGLSEYKATFGKHKTGRHKDLNKWQQVEWRKPKFPLIEKGIDKSDVSNYWKNKPVRFAKYNNCVGCFHRSASFLKTQSIEQPEKFQWFIDQEKNAKGNWKKNVSYGKIKELDFTLDMFDSLGCDSGFCGM